MKRNPFLLNNHVNFSVYTLAVLVVVCVGVFITVHLLGVIGKSLNIHFPVKVQAIVELNHITSPVNGVVKKIYQYDDNNVQKDDKLLDIALDEDTWYLYFRGGEDIKRLQAKLLHLKERLKGERIDVSEGFRQYLGSYYNYEMMTKVYKSGELSHVEEEIEKRILELEAFIQKEKVNIVAANKVIKKETDKRKELEPAYYAGAVEEGVIEGIDKRVLSAKRKIVAHNRLIDTYLQEIELKNNNKKENMNTLLEDIQETQEILFGLLYEKGINIEKMQDLSRVVSVRSPWAGKIKKHWVGDTNTFVMAGDKLFSYEEERFKVQMTFDQSEYETLALGKSIDSVEGFHVLDNKKSIVYDVESIKEDDQSFIVDGYIKETLSDKVIESKSTVLNLLFKG